MTSLEKAESALIRRIEQRASGSGKQLGRIVILAGSPGVGKSTAARQMGTHQFEVSLERPEDNPYLLDVLAGDASLGYECQNWFVSAVEGFLKGVPPDRDIVIDQDPAATGLIYGRALRLRGLLTDAESEKLLRRLGTVERLLAQRPRCQGVLLDASLDVLEARLVRRGANRPESFWLEELRERFLSLAPLARYSYLDTTERDSDQVLEAILGIAEGPEFVKQSGA